jgi:hypothetical protein
LRDLGFLSSSKDFQEWINEALTRLPEFETEIYKDYFTDNVVVNIFETCYKKIVVWTISRLIGKDCTNLALNYCCEFVLWLSKPRFPLIKDHQFKVGLH